MCYSRELRPHLHVPRQPQEATRGLRTGEFSSAADQTIANQSAGNFAKMEKAKDDDDESIESDDGRPLIRSSMPQGIGCDRQSRSGHDARRCRRLDGSLPERSVGHDSKARQARVEFQDCRKPFPRRHVTITSHGNNGGVAMPVIRNGARIGAGGTYRTPYPNSGTHLVEMLKWGSNKLWFPACSVDDDDEPLVLRAIRWHSIIDTVPMLLGWEGGSARMSGCRCFVAKPHAIICREPVAKAAIIKVRWTEVSTTTRRNDESVEPEKPATRVVLKANPNAQILYQPASSSSSHDRPTIVLKEATRPAITSQDALAPAIVLREAEQPRSGVRGESSAGREVTTSPWPEETPASRRKVTYTFAGGDSCESERHLKPRAGGDSSRWSQQRNARLDLPQHVWGS